MNGLINIEPNQTDFIDDDDRLRHEVEFIIDDRPEETAIVELLELLDDADERGDVSNSEWIAEQLSDRLGFSPIFFG